MQKINVAIDGYASCGKSTVAKDLAKAIGYTFIDSGAMYRAVTLYCIRETIDLDDPVAIDAALEQISINFVHEEGKTKAQTYLNGENVELLIRGKAVSELVSHVAKISPVRTFLREQQQEIAKEKGVVMDGRDIGTVVLPNAELKIFVTARMEVRVDRRYKQLVEKGIAMSRVDIEHNLKERDRIDSSREDSPLKQAEDAYLLDNSDLSRAEQLEIVKELFSKVTLDKETEMI